MSVLFNKENNEMIVNCRCGCENSIHLRIDREDPDDVFCLMTFLSGNWYTEQDKKVLRIWKTKLKKIWAILRNKDYYYSELFMTKDEFAQFKEFVVGIDNAN